MRPAHEVSATNFLTKSSKDYAGFSNFHGCGPSMKANTGAIFCSAFRMVSCIGLTQKRYSSLRAHLLVGGGLKLYLKQGLEGAVDPGKSQVQQMVETVLTPAHTNPLEPLLNKPFTGAFDVSTIIRLSRQFFLQSCSMLNLLCKRLHG